jgi:hypothetical protein
MIAKNIMYIAVATLAIFCLIHFFNLDAFISIAIACSVAMIYLLARLRSWQLIGKYLLHTAIVVVILFAVAMISYFIGSLLFPAYWADVLNGDLGWNFMVLGFLPLSELIWWTLIMSSAYVRISEPPGRIRKKPGPKPKVVSGVKKSNHDSKSTSSVKKRKKRHSS